MRLAALAAAGLPLLAALPGAAPGQAVSLGDLLGKAAAFIAAFERESPAVVAEETYRQVASDGQAVRDLRSDHLIIADPQAGWIGFRDVYEVNGRPVRDRDQRLMDLFLKPLPDRMAQARRIAAESARYNLPVGKFDMARTINMPLMAMRFLRGPNQDRSEFRLSGTRRLDGRNYPGVAFQERALPRIIASPEHAAAWGRFWIDPETGAPVRSELSIETGDANVRGRMVTRVAYGIDERLGVWMPLSMEEEYVVAGATLTARAAYRNFRRFAVDTAVTVR